MNDEIVARGRSPIIHLIYFISTSLFGSGRHPEWPLYDLYAHDASMDYDTPMWDGPVVD